MPHAAWIRTTSLLASLGWMVIATACGTSSANTGPGSQNPLAAPAVSAGSAPAHVFTPRPHPPRVHEPPPPPDLASLPAMIDRSAACFAPEVEEDRWSSPPPRGRGKTKSKKKRHPPAFVPYGGGGSKGASSRPARRRDPGVSGRGGRRGW